MTTWLCDKCSAVAEEASIGYFYARPCVKCGSPAGKPRVRNLRKLFRVGLDAQFYTAQHLVFRRWGRNIRCYRSPSQWMRLIT